MSKPHEFWIDDQEWENMQKWERERHEEGLRQVQEIEDAKVIKDDGNNKIETKPAQQTGKRGNVLA